VGPLKKLGEAAHPSRPNIGAIEIFDPFTMGRELRRINRLEAIALSCD
jgi:hypothetical protein